MTKLSIRKGDKIKVIAGKDKGKEAKVLATLPYKERVVVERINMVKKATRPTQRNPQGGLLEIEAPFT
jgi:large subunit ribosomal protein L24